MTKTLADTCNPKPGSVRRAGFLLLALCLTPPAAAVDVAFLPVSTGEKTAEVRGTLLLTPGDGEATVEPLTVPFSVGNEVRVDLRKGTGWTVQPVAEGYWSSPELVVPAAGVPAAGAPAVVLRLHPVGKLSGRLAVAGERPADLRLRARFRSSGAGARAAASVGLAGTVECMLGDEDALECWVPAGELDLRLRTSGFVSHYFWKRTVEAGQELDLGILQLEPGASVVGWVETEDDSPLEGSTVELKPQTSELPAMAEAARASLLTLTEEVDEQGFFHSRGLRPGVYLLTAEKQGFVPAQAIRVRVLEATEAELAEPLVLARPLPLTLDVVPRVDTDGGRWKVTLIESTDGLPATEPTAHGSTDGAGRWTQNNLRPGTYMVLISSSKISSSTGFLRRQEIDLAPDRTSFVVEIPLFAIEGHVTLGDEPLEAYLLFRARRGVSVRTRSNEEGAYHVTVPEADEWRLDVSSHEPLIFHRRRGLEIQPAPGSRTARFDVELPDTLLAGEVVDESGEPFGEARVLFMPYRSHQPPTHGKTNGAGTFSFHGNAYGTYMVEAHSLSAADNLRSTVVLMEISEESPTGTAEIVLRRTKRLSGRVLSPVGGIPGAKLSASFPTAPGTVPGHLVAAQARTGDDGSFDLDVPSDVEGVDLLVMAPGFVLKPLHVSMAQEGDVEIDVSLEQEGGTLLLHLEKPFDDRRADEPPPYVLEGGDLQLALGTLMEWSRMNGVAWKGGEVVVPGLQPGAYAVCWRGESAKTSRPCTEGFLSAGGVLEIWENPPERE